MPSSLYRSWTQFFPPKATFVESAMPDQRGRVHLVTGASSGVGKETARILYAKNATVYVAARSEDKMRAAMAEIQASAPDATGALVFVPLDLGDLATVKAAAAAFLDKASALHVLYNNAGVVGLEPMTHTPQRYEQALGVNCVATQLWTALLTPLLAATARQSPPGAVRVVWTSSYGMEVSAVPGEGMPMDNLDYKKPVDVMHRYSASKAGSWALAVEYARRHKADGILSVAINPGNLRSDLMRDRGALFRALISPITYPPVNGAYTTLYAGLSPDLTLEDSGAWSKLPQPTAPPCHHPPFPRLTCSHPLWPQVPPQAGARQQHQARVRGRHRRRCQVLRLGVGPDQGLPVDWLWERPLAVSLLSPGSCYGPLIPSSVIVVLFLGGRVRLCYQYPSLSLRLFIYMRAPL